MRVLVVNHVRLDGVLQGPGRPDEDTRDGVRQGGWAQPGRTTRRSPPHSARRTRDPSAPTRSCSGWGRRLFGPAEHPTSLTLVDSAATSTGVIVATYRR
jgi:hypothetical protein